MVQSPTVVMGVMVTELGVDVATGLLSCTSVFSSFSSLLGGSLTIWQSPTVMICVSTATGGMFSSGSTLESSSSEDESDTSMVLSCDVSEVIVWSASTLRSGSTLVTP